jgi:hypothetical protein
MIRHTANNNNLSQFYSVLYYVLYSLFSTTYTLLCTLYHVLTTVNTHFNNIRGNYNNIPSIIIYDWLINNML